MTNDKLGKCDRGRRLKRRLIGQARWLNEGYLEVERRLRDLRGLTIMAGKECDILE
jgi:hypothetical protein